MVSVSKIQEGDKGGHIAHHNELANAINGLVGEINKIVESIDSVRSDIKDTPTTLQSLKEHLKAISEEVESLSSNVLSLEKEVSKVPEKIVTYYSNRAAQTVQIEWVQEIIVGQWQAPALGVYMIDSFIYTMDVSSNIKYWIAPVKKIVEVTDMNQSVITTNLLVEAIETCVEEISFDLEVFIHKIA